MMKVTSLIVVLVAFLTVAGCRVTDAPAANPELSPLTATYVNVRGGKPPMQLYTLKLQFVNRHDYPVWIILGEYGERPVPAQDQLVARESDRFRFGQTVLSWKERTDTYHWKDGKSFGYEMYSHFRAIRLPAKSELTVDDALIETWKSISEMQVMEAADIQIDEKVSLDAWIASRITSPSGHYATLTDANRDPRSPKEIVRDAAQLPADKIQSVTFAKAGRWTVPIAGIGKAPANPWK